ncbi:MAG: alpha/beta hydrolase [Bifidobacteriaceae bacterium]|jgi:acetyl esterase|nr:alpha/beta hydrolase [Bifidobacteriaceae bacterium]
MPIDPVIKQAQRRARRLAGKPAKDPAAWREQAALVDREVAAGLISPPPPGIARRDFEVPAPRRASFRVRLYSPPGERSRGALLTFFGGAFRQGGLDFASVDRLNRARAGQAGCVIAAVDYALAPEHPYPQALEQGLAALDWLRAAGRRVGVDPARIALGGASSGANLAAAVALMNRDRGGQAPLFQLLEVPALDLTGAHLSRRAAWRMGAPPALVARGLRQIARDYLGDVSLAGEPYASPLLAPDLAGLPPAHIFAAEFDLLRGDAEAYAARLAAAGVETRLRLFAGQTHDSSCYTAALPQARAWQAEVHQILKSLAPGPPG